MPTCPSQRGPNVSIAEFPYERQPWSVALLVYCVFFCSRRVLSFLLKSSFQSLRSELLTWSPSAMPSIKATNSGPISEHFLPLNHDSVVLLELGLLLSAQTCKCRHSRKARPTRFNKGPATSVTMPRPPRPAPSNDTTAPSSQQDNPDSPTLDTFAVITPHSPVHRKIKPRSLFVLNKSWCLRTKRGEIAGTDEIPSARN